MPDTDNLGARVKSLRQVRGLSLRQLARMAGCSASFLSQLELNKASPTVANLQKIARALKMPLSDVLREEQTISEPILIGMEPEGRRLAMRWRQAMLRHILPPQTAQLFTTLTLSLEVGGSTPPRRSRNTINELAILLHGKAQLMVREQRYDLGVGKAIYYNLAEVCTWHNVGSEPAQILLVHPYEFSLFEQEEEDLRWARRKKSPALFVSAPEGD